MPGRIRTDPISSPAWYRPDIDGLRAIAVLSVMIFHAKAHYLPGGFIGVDVFFVISGFLVSRIIFKGLERGNFSFLDFYARRIRRIFPALIVVLLSACVAGWFLLLADEYDQLGKHAAYAASFFLNVVFRRESGYFDTAAELKPMLHLWSLSIEEQYYLLWPFLVFAAWKLRLGLFHLIAGLLFLSFAVNVARVGSHAVESFFLLHARFWELLIGGALAYSELNKKNWVGDSPSLSADIKATSGLVLLAAALILLSRHRAFPGWWALLPTMGTFLIISAGTSAWLNKRVLSNRWLVFVGLISYPLYLWHWPLLAFTRILGAGEPASGILVAVLMFSFLPAWLTYRFIEKPIRFAPNNPLIPIALICSLGVIGCTGLAIHRKDGFGFRLKKYEDRYKMLDTQAYRGGGLDESCQAKFPAKVIFNYCRNNSKAPPSIAVIGDSHAHAIYDGLVSELGKKQSIILLASSGCPPLLNDRVYQAGTDKTACNRVYDQILGFLAHSTVRRIYLDGEMQYHLERTGAKTPQEAYYLGTRDLIGLLTRKYDVRYIMEHPVYTVKYNDCFRPFTIKKGCNLRISEIENNAYLRPHRQIIQDLTKASSSLRVLDPTPYFCKDGQCRQILNGELLYADTHHLSQVGGRRLISYFSKLGLIN